MTGSPAGPPDGAGRTPLRRWVIPACFFVVSVTLVVAGLLLTRQDPAATASVARTPATSGPASTDPSPEPSEERRASTTAPANSTPTSAGHASTVSAPTALTIESIGVRSDLVRLGLEDDRTVEVPEDADQAGWYELGATPGEVGSAVILGHVDSTEGPAVFHRLRELAPGDRINVAMADGDDELFEVSRIETVRNADFPATEVYGSKDRPTLTLVTCGGEYDKARGGYQSNVIVYTEHVG
ncbi:class F sortase [Nocardioides gilvus]|uniref:class F sortase n=1 Tax=Nocardioides gilvus TaxID=1735589 RepID=UPI000D74D54C|nr:class F sortase [Nocardioides gilvus]